MADDKEVTTESNEPRVIMGTGVAMSARGRKSEIGPMIERAMQQAIIQAQSEGISDPDVIRGRMLDARANIKKMMGSV